MAMRTAKVLTAEPFDVNRVSIDVKPSGAKSFIGIGSETIVSQQVFVSRDPFYVFNRKIFPAVGTRGIVQ